MDRIDVELKDLQATLANIEEARPFEDLTVRLIVMWLMFSLLCRVSNEQTDDVIDAHPHIAKVLEHRLKKGMWTVPGAYPYLLPELLQLLKSPQDTRRSSATSRSCRQLPSPCIPKYNSYTAGLLAPVFWIENTSSCVPQMLITGPKW